MLPWFLTLPPVLCRPFTKHQNVLELDYFASVKHTAGRQIKCVFLTLPIKEVWNVSPFTNFNSFIERFHLVFSFRYMSSFHSHKNASPFFTFPLAAYIYSIDSFLYPIVFIFLSGFIYQPLLEHLSFFVLFTSCVLLSSAYYQSPFISLFPSLAPLSLASLETFTGNKWRPPTLDFKYSIANFLYQEYCATLMRILVKI